MALCNFRSLYIIVLLFQLLSILIPLASPLYFSLSGKDLNSTSLKFTNDSYSDGNTVQLTRNRAGTTLDYSVGSATYFEAVHLWDKASGTLANFTTNFIFSINRINKSQSSNYGDGLAFFLSPFPFKRPENSTGGALGLFKDGGKNISENQIVAIEFDTYKNFEYNDSSSDHVGIDIWSIFSKTYVDLKDTIVGSVQFHAIVSYNAATQNLSVLLTQFSDPQPTWNLFYVVDLRKYLPNEVAIGFSAATGTLYETHRIYSWDFDSSYLSSPSPATNPSSQGLAPTPGRSHQPPTKSKTALVLGLVLGIGLPCMLGSVWFLMWRKKTNGGIEEDEMALELSIDHEFERGHGPKRFSYSALARATRNFPMEGKLGEGGFGEVYKGVLQDSQLEVAIKRISRDSKQGIKEYVSEVTIISRLRHRNLVQLVGYCHEKGDLLLVYEYMPNKSLDYHLYGEERLLTWPERYKIALGLASALLYLHEEWEQSVVHRDVKPSNVMLDSEFNAKLGDFGLARLVDHDRSMQTTDIAGTRGYISPEYATTGKASKESDVYSFGIVILEIVCGRKPVDVKEQLAKVNLVEWVWELYEKNICLTAVDEKLKMDFDEQQVERFIIVGLWCAHPDYKLRPPIRKAIQVLNFDAPLPHLPSKNPVPMYFTPMDVSNLVPTTSSSS